MKITNVSDGPRGVWADGSVVMLAPGESRDDLRVLPGDLASAEASGWFSFDGSAVTNESEKEKASVIDFTKRTDEELRAYLAEHEVKADGRWSRERLISEAEKVKG